MGHWFYWYLCLGRSNQCIILLKRIDAVIQPNSDEGEYMSIWYTLFRGVLNRFSFPFFIYTQWDFYCLFEVRRNFLSKKHKFGCISLLFESNLIFIANPPNPLKITIIGKEKMTYCWDRLRYLYPWEFSFCIYPSDLWYQFFC